MTTLPNMSLVLPTRGPSGAGLWGDTEDANLNKLDIHDHSSGKGARITPAGLNINADLPFSALYAPTQLHRLQFSAIAGAGLTAGQRKSLFVADGTGGFVANELYFLTNSGASIQITTGSSLNVGAFVAGIGGDYAGVGAQLNYTDSSKTYDFKESTADSHAWARVQCGGIRLIEFNTTETFFVAQIAPAALGASYTVTWPTAVPGALSLVSVDNSGQIAFAATGGVQDITLAANSHVTVSGTGDFKHGTRTLQLPVFGNTNGASVWKVATIASSFTTWDVAIPLRNGDRILAVRLRMKDSVTGPTKLTIGLQSVVDGTVSATIATSGQSAGSGAAQTIAVSGLTTTIASGTNYQAHVNTATGTDNCSIYWIEIDYDRP